ncbi:MAG TPA: ABC transporter permease [Anaerolineales bacterium]|nr:ABC transporter permease [Anaerolineales bacterium]
MTAFGTHFSFVFKSGLRNSNLLMINYLFPFGFFVAMGVVMTSINPGFIDVLVPAMAIFAILASTILGLPNPLVDDREAGVFRSFKIYGVPAISIVIIPALTTIFHAMIAATVIALTAGPLFGGVPPESWPALFLVLLVTAFACGGLGTLIGVISTSSRATVLWTQLIFVPSMLIGGLMVPLTLLPESVLPAAGLLPTSHAMQAIEGLAYGRTTAFGPWLSLGALAVGALVAFGLASYLFNWDARNASRRGHPALAVLVLVPYLVATLVGMV